MMGTHRANYAPVLGHTPSEWCNVYAISEDEARWLIDAAMIEADYLGMHGCWITYGRKVERIEEDGYTPNGKAVRNETPATYRAAPDSEIYEA